MCDFADALAEGEGSVFYVLTLLSNRAEGGGSAAHVLTLLNIGLRERNHFL